MFNGIKFWQMGKVIVFGAGGAGKRASLEGYLKSRNRERAKELPGKRGMGGGTHRFP